MFKRKICIFTGARADYGLLRPLLDSIASDNALRLQIIASAMHLSREFGLTYKQIEADGFAIDAKIKILFNSDSPLGICKSMGRGLSKYSQALSRLSPDILVILGDRFEAFSVAVAATVCRIPIAHLYGGEATFGAIDEAMRHSITKMSHLHFASTEAYRKRIIQLGEHPSRVFAVGALGLDNIRELKLLSKKELENELHFSFNRHALIVTFHPVTLEHNTSAEQFRQLLAVLDELKETSLIFTKANADTHGRVINAMVDEYVRRRSHKAIGFSSLGQLKYLSCLQFVDAVVGNSSSGIIEAPSFKIGTINIGDRQKGRIRAGSIIDCEPNKQSLKKAFVTLYSDRFQRRLKRVINPYGDGNAGVRIKAIIKDFDLRNILKKKFYDIRYSVK